MTAEEARRRFASARVARLASADSAGHPHVVPIAFALSGERVYSVVDAKRKRTTALRRLANVRANPAVAVLADYYEDADWTTLWWVRADGNGTVLDPGAPEARQAVALLRERYPLLEAVGEVLRIDVERWTGWSASEP